MRSTLTLLTLFSFLAIALFGFAAMNYSGEGGEHGHTDCLAVQAQAADCSSRTGALEMIAMHVSVFHLFSGAVFQPNILSLVSVFLLLLFGAGFLSIFKTYFAEREPGLSLIGNRFYPFAFQYSSGEKLTRRLALYENSPSAMKRR